MTFINIKGFGRVNFSQSFIASRELLPKNLDKFSHEASPAQKRQA
jgi:hypothetical protein